MTAKRLAPLALGIVALTLVVYAPVAHYDFVDLDDPGYVSQNANIAGGLTVQSLSWALTTGHAANWHPLTWLSHIVDVELFGLNAGAHHAMSVALHVVAALLCFGVLVRLTGAPGRSAFVAALFAVHPLHVESVAWIAERKDVLSTILWMLTLWAYVAYVKRPRPGSYARVVALFALGLMAKPMLVTLPFVLLLLDVWPLKAHAAAGLEARGRRANRRRQGSGGPPKLHAKAEAPQRRERLRALLPLFALAAASSVITLLVQQKGGAISGLDALPWTLRAANALWSYVAYIGKMIWPVDLAVFYPYPLSMSAWPVVAAVVILAAVTALVVRAVARRPYLFVGWLWFLGTLVPVIGFVQVGTQAMADRYTYVPLIGLFIVVAWGVPDLIARWPALTRALPALATGVVLACTLTARAQVRHWENSLALWTRAVAVTTDNYRAHNSLGAVLGNLGRTKEAEAHFLEALRLKPDRGEAHHIHHNLGRALADQGKIDEAIAHYTEALRIKPEFAEAHNNLGLELAKKGRLADAVGHYTEALRINPDMTVARSNLVLARNALGFSLAADGKMTEAVAEFSEAVRLEPNFAQAHFNLGLAFGALGRFSDATREFNTVLALDPKNEGARRALERIRKPSR